MSSLIASLYFIQSSNSSDVDAILIQEEVAEAVKIRSLSVYDALTEVVPNA